MRKIYLILPILAGFMFGSSGIFVRTLTQNGIDATTLLFLRFSIAIIPITIAILLTDKKLFKINLKNIPLFLICAISIVGLNLCYNNSMNTISLSLAAVLLSTAPIFVLIFAHIFFREKITSKKIICIFLAIFGCILMTGIFENNITTLPTSGILSGIGAAVFWAIYLMASKKSIEKGNHTFTILFYSIIFITIALIPFTDFNQISSFVLINPTLTIIFLILHSTFSFAMPYILSTISLKYIDSGISSILLSGAEPFAALIFGFLIYSEMPTWLMFCGLILTIVSMIMLSKNDSTLKLFYKNLLNFKNKNKLMSISIVIPTYNEEEYLPKLLDSIKMQSFSDYEIIVADANSTDRTREIAEEYGCVVVDGGLPAVGRNNGAKVAKGEYILFLDSDLELTDDYLRNALYEFRMERAGIAITTMIPSSNKILDKLYHDFGNYFMVGAEKIKPHGAGCYGIIVKKSLHDECGGFDESLTFGEDTDYIERLAKKDKFKVLRNAQVSVSTRRLEEEGIETLIRQYGKSTVNDFLGKRTGADDLNYNFDHGNENATSPRFETLEKRVEQIDKIRENYDKSVEIVKHAQDNLKQDHIRDKKVIFYCVCGEGMGHSIRTGVIVDKLKEKYDIYIFTHGNAYKYLKSKFDNVFMIGGFNTVYINNKVDNSKTLRNALIRNPYNLKDNYDELYKKARELSPEVIVTDFEIYSTYVSKLLNIPLISLDNMHIITQAKISYPQNQRLEMLKAKAVIKTYVVKPKIHIITSFFYPKIRARKHAVIYPPIIREDIMKLKPSTKDYIVVYQTSKESAKIVKGLKALKDEKFIIYGFNKNEVDENLTYKEFNEDEFYDDLANAKAVVCNGGFTFISEAICLKKPIYSVPAKGNFEQVLNGYYVQRLGYGEYHEKMSINKLAKFLKKLPKYQKRLSKVKPTNNDGIIKELIYRIEKYSK